MRLDDLYLLPEPEGHASLAQLVLQRFDDLTVTEVEHGGPLLDHGDLGAQRREHRRVLDADDTSSDDDHRSRNPIECQDLVGVDDGGAVEVHRGRARGPRTDGDDELVGAHVFEIAGGVLDRYFVRTREVRTAEQHGHTIASELALNDIDFFPDDVHGAGRKIRDRYIRFQPI